MYITNTTENVKELFENIERSDDKLKIKFLIYILNQLNNNQINEKNNINPSLYDNEDLIIFSPDSCGLNIEEIDELIYQNVTVYNKIIGKNELYVEQGNVIGLDFNKNEMKTLAKYESLSFIEKIDVFGEVFIRYDNDSYYDGNYNTFTFSFNITGFDVASIIKEYKKRLKN